MRNKVTIVDGVRWGECKLCLKEFVELFRTRNICKDCYRPYVRSQKCDRPYKIRDCVTCGVECRTKGTQCKECHRIRQNTYNKLHRDRKRVNFKKIIIRTEYHNAKIKLDDGSEILTKNGSISYNEVIQLLKSGFDFILINNWQKVLAILKNNS